MHKPSHHLSLALVAALALAGCQAAPMPSTPVGAAARPGLPSAAAPKAPAADAAARAGAERESFLGAPVAAASAMPSSAGVIGGPVVSVGGAAIPPQRSASDLKAGAVDDNKGFAAYLKYLAEFGEADSLEAAPKKLEVKNRKIITVLDAAGKPVHDAQLTVALPAMTSPPGPNGQTSVLRPTVALRSYADGRAVFQPATPEVQASQGLEVRAEKGDLVATATLLPGAEDLTIKLPAAVNRVATGIPLDVAVVIDTTGSMAGEISKFQATMLSIAERIKLLPQAPNVRYSLVSYRDKGETYVTQVKDFTSKASDLQRSLDDLVADGGGDKPEHMEAALKEAVQTLSWTRDGAVRLSFLVADAAPHTDYQDSVSYVTSMKQAAAAGIKFYPIGASGLEREGEYVMRQLAQWTMGQYLFVTRGGDEGAGGGGTASAEVDKFREGRLDDIVVDIVKAELSHFRQ